MGDRETGGTVRLFAAREFFFGIAARLSRAMRGGGGKDRAVQRFWRSPGR